jgi:hypothetical protein
MTYCCGILVRDGLVMIADTRTNAGLDNVSTFRKLHVFSDPGQRILAVATAGNLAISQSVISTLTEGIQNPDTGELETLMNAPTMFQAAQRIDCLRRRGHPSILGACQIGDRPASGIVQQVHVRVREISHDGGSEADVRRRKTNPDIGDIYHMKRTTIFIPGGRRPPQGVARARYRRRSRKRPACCLRADRFRSATRHSVGAWLGRRFVLRPTALIIGRQVVAKVPTCFLLDR